MARLCGRLLFTDRSLDERTEKRMRGERPSFEFGMELRAEHKWMHIFRKFCDLHQAAVGRFTGEDKSRTFESLCVLGIHFKTMAMALGDCFFLVCLACDSPGGQIARIGAKAHCAAVGSASHLLPLLRQYRDHWMRSACINFCSMRATQAGDVARV